MKKWVEFHNMIKSRYLTIVPNLWWGDDLDVRFYSLRKLMHIKDKKVLDIGCNIGIALSFLDKSNELYGIEIDDYCVSEAKKLNPNAKIYQGSMEKLPYEDNYFDIVVMMNVFPFYDFFVEANNKEDFINNTLGEVYRVLKKDGKLYFSTPNGESIHYKNIKANQKNLDDALSNFEYILKGWNNLNPIFPFLPKRYRFIPPRLLCKFEFVWKYLLNNMDKNINSSKYFYLEARKKLNDIKKV